MPVCTDVFWKYMFAIVHVMPAGIQIVLSKYFKIFANVLQKDIKVKS